MHTQELALKTLEHLQNNDHIVRTQVDRTLMPCDRLAEMVQKNVPINSLLLATWLQNQGYYMSLWSLWEYYSRNLCEGMPITVKKKNNQSHVEWVRDTFHANNQTFAEYDWFVGGNAFRNLIAHYATRVGEPQATKLWHQAKAVFTDLVCDPQQYLLIDHDHTVALLWKVENFIQDPTQPAPWDDRAASRATAGGTA
jgi:hypothetical protein